MSVTSNETQKTTAAQSQEDAIERALIDASTKAPVLAFFASSIFWLLVQGAIGTLASLKIFWPDFLSGCGWLTYGRIVPVRDNLLIYGWAAMAGFGTCLWILARLCRVRLPRPATLVAGVALWNIGLIVGTLEILAGNSRGFQYLEFPPYVFGILFVAYSLVAVWGVLLFVNRRPGHVYISVWYFIGALFWFPWLVGGTNLIVGVSGNGIFEAITAAWYAQGLLTLWMTALAVGSIYYLVPKVVGRPIHSYNLASVGFWTFAIFAVWTGVQRLTGGPIPAWIITVSIVASILLLIPVALVTANYFLTLRGDFNLVYHSPTIRFAFFGAVAYTVVHVLFTVSSFRSVGDVTASTWFATGLDQFFILPFYSMVMFGAMYYIIPRLVGCEWLSASFIKMHFWASAYGFGFSIALLLMAGYSQGAQQAIVAQHDLVNVHSEASLWYEAYMPFLRGNLGAQLFICFGQVIFALHFVLMLLRLGRPSGAQPTLFAPIQEGTKP